MYGLSAADEDIQARARVFADELIPLEVQAELDGGLPDDVTAAHKKRAIELGLFATNMPAALGGVGATALQQVLVQEQVGRVTNALGWVAATPPSWFPPVATDDQVERYLRPTVRGEREECYAITEASAGSDVDAIEATAYRDGDEWVLNGVKWHVTSYNSADYCFFQAKKINPIHPERSRGDSSHPTAGHRRRCRPKPSRTLPRRPMPRLSTCSSSSTCRPPASPSCAPPRTRTRSATITRSSSSPTSASRPPTWSGPRAAECSTRASGSASSG